MARIHVHAPCFAAMHLLALLSHTYLKTSFIYFRQPVLLLEPTPKNQASIMISILKFLVFVIFSSLAGAVPSHKLNSPQNHITQTGTSLFCNLVVCFVPNPVSLYNILK
jgi:hypothetical protein